jgi:hypothetical protein
MSEAGADQKAEKLKRRSKAGGGTAEDRSRAHQTDTACNEHAKDLIPQRLAYSN